MIPSSFTRRLSPPSPQESERDLARMINRTIDLAIAAKRELGFAAVNIGCDGVKRTTMFDGSACQTDGEVCIASREQGITACIEAPSRGNGLTFQSVTFAAPACQPVTGWFLVDAEGYLYRVPAALVAAAPYWPMTLDPLLPESVVTLARAGTWAARMCGASLVVPLNGSGGAVWMSAAESDWFQAFLMSIGGRLTEITTVPTIVGTSTDTGAENQILATGGKATIDDVPDQDIVAYLWFNGRDVNGSEIGMTEEYQAKVGWAYSGLVASLGAKALIGASEPPASYPSNTIPLCSVTFVRTTITFEGITYERFWIGGDHGGDPYLAATITPVVAVGDSIRRLIPDVSLTASQYRAVLLRDFLAPNAGSRAVNITLPSATSGIVSGDVRVAYGYPLGTTQGAVTGASPTSIRPYARALLVGTPEADCTGRVVGDMALCYRRGLAIEYAPGHVCLDGADIDGAADFISLDEIDLTDGPALDVASDLVAMPGGEVAVFGDTAIHDLRVGKRYRIRPAVATAPTVVAEQQAKGAWGDDPNLWIAYSRYPVAAWLAGATTFSVYAWLSGATGPGRSVPVVLYESNVSDDTYLTAPVKYPGTLGNTVGALTTITFDSPIGASTMTYRGLAIVGPVCFGVAYGWTAEVLVNPADPASASYETAMSPLSSFAGEYIVPGVGIHVGGGANPSKPLFSLKVTTPAGPTGTVRIKVYRFAFSSAGTGVGPWVYESISPAVGGLYDRQCRLVKTLTGAGPFTFYDEDTSLTLVGTRPPSPLVYLGPIAVDAPRPVHLIQPMNL